MACEIHGRPDCGDYMLPDIAGLTGAERVARRQTEEPVSSSEPLEG